MGTRADFYNGRGRDAQWLGSIAWDGYPEGVPAELLGEDVSEKWLEGVAGFLSGRDDATTPDRGWPWPWDDSSTTDFAYAFDDGKVWVSNFGTKWIEAASYKSLTGEELEALPETAVFPDMSDEKNVTFGRRSGVIVGRP